MASIGRAHASAATGSGRDKIFGGSGRLPGCLGHRVAPRKVSHRMPVGSVRSARGRCAAPRPSRPASPRGPTPAFTQARAHRHPLPWRVLRSGRQAWKAVEAVTREFVLGQYVRPSSVERSMAKSPKRSRRSIAMGWHGTATARPAVPPTATSDSRRDVINFLVASSVADQDAAAEAARRTHKVISKSRLPDPAARP